ncbi:hypothetical protein FB451DRAFT_1273745 [Mycena latifolia]|nr:hypothetical protein FB451DRAFT_1273745 [Mycena latifolia]
MGLGVGIGCAICGRPSVVRRAGAFVLSIHRLVHPLAPLPLPTATFRRQCATTGGTTMTMMTTQTKRNRMGRCECTPAMLARIVSGAASPPVAFQPAMRIFKRPAAPIPLPPNLRITTSAALTSSLLNSLPFGTLLVIQVCASHLLLGQADAPHRCVQRPLPARPPCNQMARAHHSRASH